MKNSILARLGGMLISTFLPLNLLAIILYSSIINQTSNQVQEAYQREPDAAMNGLIYGLKNIGERYFSLPISYMTEMTLEEGGSPLTTLEMLEDFHRVWESSGRDGQAWLLLRGLHGRGRGCHGHQPARAPGHIYQKSGAAGKAHGGNPSEREAHIQRCGRPISGRDPGGLESLQDGCGSHSAGADRGIQSRRKAARVRSQECGPDSNYYNRPNGSAWHQGESIGFAEAEGGRSMVGTSVRLLTTRRPHGRIRDKST